MVALGPKLFPAETFEKQGRFQFAKPITVVVHDKTTPPTKAAGTWRKISLDSQTNAFIYQWWKAKKGTTPADKNLASAYKICAEHTPVNIIYEELTPDVEEKLFTKAWQLAADFGLDEETFAPGGWGICCMLAQARLLKNGADIESVDALAAQIKFSKSADFAKGKKATQVGLNIYDRIVGANLVDEIASARVAHPKSVMDQFTKLELVVAKASAARYHLE